ncbi:Mitochondrial import inner membrane translocase subunit TIM23-2 [Acorus calamus]|uniref:Mitochondrial import inner membrane translocase subunit TIM23-2 n=1 Tax=Acorus calamus TaxID=4465 RepID=A0AAV9DTD2_ACOCL|nr:Mitochondrial import inner membrane translocase subunit TIM23-2 [Acorus calamus]
MEDPRDGHDEGGRFYNPYEHLSPDFPIHNLYRLPTSPEFLFQEESLKRHRSVGENITYYTGCGYLGGSISGGAKGVVDGVRSFEHGDTAKLRVTRLLNATGSTGRRVGNRLGIIGLLYAGFEGAVVYVRDEDDMINSMLAGLGTGLLYKAASGPRAAALAGAIGGLAVGVAVGAKQVLKRYVPI